MTSLKEWIFPTTGKGIIHQIASLDAADIVLEDFKPRHGVANRLAPQAVQIADVHHSYVRVNPAVLEQQRKQEGSPGH